MDVNTLKEFKTSIQTIREKRREAISPFELLEEHTEMVDLMIKRLFQEVMGYHPDEREGLALVAVGGYGRRELTPWSDIDLMFLCSDLEDQEVIVTVYRILHALWDLHLDVGHSVRTPSDCIEVSLRDIRTWTALMDARLVAGDAKLYEVFLKELQKDLFGKKRELFIERMVQQVRERHRAYARSPYLLEPHIKEGIGGLRDYQSALWLARARVPVKRLDDLILHALISEEEARGIREALDFMLRVRNELHAISSKKEDHLTFDVQERLSPIFGFKDAEHVLGVEGFMRHYYMHATRIHYFVEEITQKATDPSLARGPDGPTYTPTELGPAFKVVRGRLTLVDEGAIHQTPELILEALAYAFRRGLEPDILLQDHIKGSLWLVDEAFRRSKRASRAFLSLLSGPDCGYRALLLMHRLGLLQAYLPEFKRICFQVQHDAYHAYTVDVHSIEAVGELCRLLTGGYRGSYPFVEQVAKGITNTAPLAIAALLHDIGKGEGRGHAQRGRTISQAILERLHLTEPMTELVLFLVENHILLMDTAMGRDLNDEKVLEEFTRRVEDKERLQALYILTLADLLATGPDVLTDWKDQLMRELYLKALHLLERGELVSPEASERMEEAKRFIFHHLEGRIPPEELQEWVDALPGRYLLITPLDDLGDHIMMAHLLNRDDEVVRVSFKEHDTHLEVTVCTRDAPGLFSHICGVMVANGINILAAQIHTWENGIAMDVFHVKLLESGRLVSPERLRRFVADLEGVLSGEMGLEGLLKERSPTLGLMARRYPRIPTRVSIDNRASDFYTLVEVRSVDRFGLLFTITRTLAELGLDIHLAKIDTRRGQVMDVFYVQDSEGQKVWESEKLALVERELHRALERLEESEVPISPKTNLGAL